MGDTILLILEIMLINLVLSGDNAVVIAMASRNLPPEQRRKAVWWGSMAAVVLRILLTFIAVYLLDIPFIETVGSLLLFYIAVKLLLDEEGGADVKEAGTLGSAIGVILMADFIMSLDNVLAIAGAAKGDLLVIGVGIAVSIPMVVWGSTLIMKLLHKFPILVYIGAGILGYTAGEMLSDDEKTIGLLNLSDEMLHWGIPILGAVLVLVGGWLGKRLRHKRTLGTSNE